jgi:hypothetical protein
MKKDLILGCITNYTFDKVANWVNSIDRSGFDGHKLVIAYNVGFDIVDELTKRNFTVVTFNRDDANRRFIYRENFNIVVDRFYHSWKVLNDIEDQVRYVIATDVRDVVFQTNPSETLTRFNSFAQYDGLQKIIASTEGISYRNEQWGNNNMRLSFPYVHEYMLDKTIYNAGVIAGLASTVKDLFLNIYMICANMPHTIPGGGGPDQAAYNTLLTMKEYKSITRFTNASDAWAAQLGTVADPSKINQYRPYLTDHEPIIQNGEVFNNEGQKYCIVHQYDRVPNLFPLINAKYGV